METLEILKAIKEQHLTDRQLGLLDLLEEAMKAKDEEIERLKDELSFEQNRENGWMSK